MVSAEKIIVLTLVFITFCSVAEACSAAWFSREKCDERCRECNKCQGVISCYIHCGNCGLCRYKQQEENQFRPECEGKHNKKRLRGSDLQREDEFISVDESENRNAPPSESEKQLTNQYIRVNVIPDSIHRESILPNTSIQGYGAKSAPSMKNDEKSNSSMRVVLPNTVVASDTLSGQLMQSKKLSDTSIRIVVPLFTKPPVSSNQPSTSIRINTESTSRILDHRNHDITVQDLPKQARFPDTAIQHEKISDPSMRGVASDADTTHNERSGSLILNEGCTGSSCGGIISMPHQPIRDVPLHGRSSPSIDSVPRIAKSTRAPPLTTENLYNSAVLGVAVTATPLQNSSFQSQSTYSSPISDEGCKQRQCGKHIRISEQPITVSFQDRSLVSTDFVPITNVPNHSPRGITRTTPSQPNATTDPERINDLLTPKNELNQAIRGVASSDLPPQNYFRQSQPTRSSPISGGCKQQPCENSLTTLKPITGFSYQDHSLGPTDSVPPENVSNQAPLGVALTAPQVPNGSTSDPESIKDLLIPPDKLNQTTHDAPLVVLPQSNDKLQPKNTDNLPITEEKCDETSCTSHLKKSHIPIRAVLPSFPSLSSLATSPIPPNNVLNSFPDVSLVASPLQNSSFQSNVTNSSPILAESCTDTECKIRNFVNTEELMQAIPPPNSPLPALLSTSTSPQEGYSSQVKAVKSVHPNESSTLPILSQKFTPVTNVRKLITLPKKRRFRAHSRTLPQLDLIRMAQRLQPRRKLKQNV